MVKNPPAMQEAKVQSLGQEDPLEKEMATHSSILAWEIHRQRNLVGYSPVQFSHSVGSNSLQPHWIVAHQAPLSMGFSRQEYWSGLPFLSPGDLPDPRIEPESPALQVDYLSTEPPGKTLMSRICFNIIRAGGDGWFK